MRLPFMKIVIIGFFFAVAITLFVLIFTTKHTPAPSLNTVQDDNTVTNYINEVQRKTDLERDEKEQADKLAKLAKAKKDSVECQFWKQQQAQKNTPKVEEKITQFCEL